MADRDVSGGAALAVIQLYADYGRLIDARDAAAGWSELFTPDGCLELADRSIVGRAALATFATESTPGIHTTGLPSLTGAAGDEVSCEAPFIFFSIATAGLIAGWYRDRLVWDGDRLLFVNRRVERNLTMPGSL